MGWRVALWAALVVGVVFFLYLVRSILAPFAIALILASLLEPVVWKLRERGIPRGRAVACVMAGFLLVATALGLLLVPHITGQITNLAARVDDLTRYLSRTNESDNYFLSWSPSVQVERDTPTTQVDRLFTQYGSYLDRLGLPSTRQAFFEQYIETQQPRIAQAVQAGFNAFFGVLTNIFSQLIFVILIPVLIPLMLLDMDKLKERGPTWIPPRIRASTLALLGDIGNVFMHYLRGISTVVLLTMISQSVVLVLLNVPYGILLAVLCGVLYLIPYIGNIGSALVILTIVGFSDVSGNALFQLPNPWAYAALCTAVSFGVSQVFDQLLTPQLVGGSVGLSPSVSMFVSFCGFALLGIAGMVLAFPLAGATKIVLDRLVKLTTVPTDTLVLPAVPIRHRVQT